MGLLTFFRRRTNAADSPTRSVDSTDDIALARTRARRRLLGAAVLVMAGVIGFPLVFETQPRPVPVDIPIEIPRKDGAPSLAMPPARAASGKSSAPLVASPREETPAQPPAEGPREGAAPASAPAEKLAPAAEPKKAVAEPTKAAPVAPPDAARAKALLEGKAEAKAEPKPAAKPAEVKTEPARDGGRFVVQAGAFADANAAREMRAKLEKLGLKSYTQVVETSSGSRTRVRAGPYATRDEAERALAKAKAAGVAGVVLTL